MVLSPGTTIERETIIKRETFAVNGDILIASRDKACYGPLLNVFSKRGFATVILANDVDLLLALLEHDYRVVIYDLETCPHDGLKMVRILKKCRPKISLIVISRDASRELGGNVWQEGVAYYAVKPVDYAAIENTVFRLLK